MLCDDPPPLCHLESTTEWAFPLHVAALNRQNTQAGLIAAAFHFGVPMQALWHRARWHTAIAYWHSEMEWRPSNVISHTCDFPTMTKVCRVYFQTLLGPRATPKLPRSEGIKLSMEHWFIRRFAGGDAEASLSFSLQLVYLAPSRQWQRSSWCDTVFAGVPVAQEPNSGDSSPLRRGDARHSRGVCQREWK